MPQRRKIQKAMAVKVRYMRNRTWVMSLRRGENRSDVGPDASALCIKIICCPDAGKRAMKMTTIPRPPSQCVMLRQNKILNGNDSKSSMTVAPVPVKPDMLSKTASITVRYPPRAYGSMPRTVAKSQPGELRLPQLQLMKFFLKIGK